MILKKQNLKIATILPYKENYSVDKASAASLWVSEFFKNSKFRKKIQNCIGFSYKNSFLVCFVLAYLFPYLPTWDDGPNNKKTVWESFLLLRRRCERFGCVALGGSCAAWPRNS